jgi:pheromone shutdown protein TraB
MNWFVVIQAVLCIAASGFEFYRGNTKLAVVYLAWALSNGSMSTMGSK